MQKTLILCSHSRPIQERTLQSVSDCVARGAAFLTQAGITDVTLARNLALSGALRASADQDVILMVDDDMVFTADDAEQLVTHARETNVAASAMYGTTMGTLAATRLKTASGAQRWATGLGLLAIPVALLTELAARSAQFDFEGSKSWGFTWSLASGGNYWSEDFTLCRRLGGVHLLPIAVGHLKTIPIYPDDETVACVRDGRRLRGDLDSKVLAHVQDGDMAAAARFLPGEPDALGNEVRHGDA